MRNLRFAAGLAAILWIAAPAAAQIAPGIRAPTSMLDGATITHRTACFMSAARRPYPGINQPSGGLAGEGVTEQSQPPAWLAGFVPPDGKARFSTLETPEGPIWIVYDARRDSCLIAAKPADADAYRNGFVKQLSEGKFAWKLIVGEPGSSVVTFGNRIEGSPILWTTRIWSPDGHPDVVLIDTTATGH